MCHCKVAIYQTIVEDLRVNRRHKAVPTLLTYLLTYSMEQSPSWKVNRPCSWSRKSPYFVEPEVSLPHSQVPSSCPYTKPARSSSHLLEIHLNIIFPSTPGSPKWSLSLRFSDQNPVHASPLTHTPYMPIPSHSSRFYNPNNMRWGLQIIKLFMM